MAYIPKTWTDRDSEFPNRRIITHADSTEEQVTVRRDEGTVTTEGDPFAAASMNNLESRIAAGITSSVTTDTYNALDTVDKSVIGAINETAGEKNLAPQYDMAETYAVGDYVIYETVLYKCIVGTTGGFDTDCWERVLVTDEMGHGGGGASALDDLTDVSIIAPTVGQALVFNGTGWENDDVSGGSSSLAELSDVVISSPSDKQGLVYDAQSGKWINGDSSGFALDKVASGSVVSFNDGADDLPVIDLTAQITAVQSGSGDPSPSNVRQISGFTGAHIGYVDFNQKLFSLSSDSWESSDATFSDGVCTWTPTAQYSQVLQKNTNEKKVYLTKGHTYFFSVEIQNANAQQLNIYTGGAYWLAQNVQSTSYKRYTSILTVSVTTGYWRLIIQTNASSGWGTLNIKNIQIFDLTQMFGVIAGDVTADNFVSLFHKDYYEKTDGGTLVTVNSVNGDNLCPNTSVTWQTEAGTVYGGSIDLTTGLLTVTHGSIVFDGTQANNAFGITIKENFSQVSWVTYIDIGVPKAQFMSEQFKQVAGQSSATGEGYMWNSTVTRMFFSLPKTVTNGADVNAYFAQNPVRFVYPLATPQTYQLTPTEVKTLLGNNTIVADTGDVSVDYQTEQASDIIDLVGEGGASDLADLGDVDLTTPTDGQVLTYDATAGKWVNEDVAGTHVVVEKTVLGSVPVKPSSISTLTVTDAMGTDCVKVKQYLECAQIDAPRYDPPREDLGTIQAVSFTQLRHTHNGTTDTYNTSFSTSFFGGEYDFISGTVKVTLDAMSIQTCTMHNTYPSLFAKAIDSKFVQSISAFIKSSIYTLTKGVLQLNAVKDHEIIIYNGDWNGTTRLWAVWKDTRFTTNSQMTTWLADNHQITLVGLLQTPYYLQATAHAIALDEGENTFESYGMLEFGARIELTYISDDAESIIDEFQAQTGIGDLNDTQILNPSNNQALLYDSTAGTWQNKAVPVPWVEVTGNLAVGSTSITLSDASITSSSTIDVYTDPELPHTAISVTTGSVTITFEAQQTIIAVKVRVS